MMPLNSSRCLSCPKRPITANYHYQKDEKNAVNHYGVLPVAVNHGLLVITCLNERALNYLCCGINYLTRSQGSNRFLNLT